MSHAAAARENHAAEAIIGNKRPGVPQHREATSRLPVRHASAKSAPESALVTSS